VLGERHPFGIESLSYDLYWRARGDHQVVARFPIIAQYLCKGETLLDIGCGEGTGLAYLVRRAGVVGSGIDISEVAVQLARAKGVDARVLDATSPAFQPEHPYDTVLISEVLEHVSEPERLLETVRPYVRTRLILTFPNIAYLPHRLRLLLGSFPVQWGWHPGEHLRFWSLSDFTWWLDQLGYDVAQVKASNGIRGLYKLRPSLFGNQIVIVARPRPDP
jgi:methionine biosynthesis protein MetW